LPNESCFKTPNQSDSTQESSEVVSRTAQELKNHIVEETSGDVLENGQNIIAQNFESKNENLESVALPAGITDTHFYDSSNAIEQIGVEDDVADPGDANNLQEQSVSAKTQSQDSSGSESVQILDPESISSESSVIELVVVTMLLTFFFFSDAEAK
jgi:hypothetical protein